MMQRTLPSIEKSGLCLEHAAGDANDLDRGLEICATALREMEAMDRETSLEAIFEILRSEIRGE